MLAKVDVDRNQAIAGQLQIQSIPTVLLAIGGRLVQGFTGALPERDLRSFLEQVLPPRPRPACPVPAARPAEAAPPPADPDVVAAEDAMAEGDYAAAVAAYDRLLARKPADAEAVAGKAWAQLLERSADADPDGRARRGAGAPDDVAAQTAAADVEVLPSASTTRSPGSCVRPAQQRRRPRHRPPPPAVAVRRARPRRPPDRHRAAVAVERAVLARQSISAA